MRIDPYYVNTLVGSLDQTTATEQQLTTELSSGVRVTSLSTDPVAAGQSSVLSAEISAQDTFVQTAASAQGLLQTTDSALGSAVTQLTTAISLGVSGNQGSLNAAEVKSIAQQLIALRSNVLSLANTTYQGKYIFAGSQGGTQPFTLNTAATPATTTYTGDSAVQTIQTPSGQTTQLNLPGNAVFSATGADVFGALSNLIADFSTGTSGPTSAADVGNLKTALDNVSQQRVVLDGSLNRLQAASTLSQTNVAQLSATQTSLVGADTASIATQLSMSETQHQALLNVISTLEKGSLFDYTH
ncbi:MAG: flagellin N-terminal helical domain-containing protein [Acidobacteriaceae bacterium]